MISPPHILSSGFRACRSITRRYAKSFYFASHVLPREKRMASYAIYAFCRQADNIADDAESRNDPSRVPERLQQLRTGLHAVYERGDLDDPTLLALRDTVQRYDIPESYFLDLLRGVEMDLTVTRYETFAQLEEYCYCVASVVGLMMTHIFGVSNPEALRYARELGTAMQLTNILRDIREDVERGRIYLPVDELDAFGYTEADLHQGVVNESFRRLMRFQIDRARALYRSSARGIPSLTNDGSRFCVRLMGTIYGRILDAIESRGYDVYAGRAHVPFLKKVSIALHIAVTSDVDDRTVEPVDRSSGEAPGRQTALTDPSSVIRGR